MVDVHIVFDHGQHFQTKLLDRISRDGRALFRKRENCPISLTTMPYGVRTTEESACVNHHSAIAAPTAS